MSLKALTLGFYTHNGNEKKGHTLATFCKNNYEAIVKDLSESKGDPRMTPKQKEPTLFSLSCESKEIWERESVLKFS